MFRFLLLFALIVFLSGCPYDPDRILANPGVGDVVGIWEGRGLLESVPFSLVEIRASGHGEVVVSGDRGAEVYAQIKKMRFFRNSFEFEVHHLEYQEKLATFKAQIVYGQICITEMNGKAFFDKKTPTWCFVRQTKLDEYRRNAIKTYEDFKKKSS